MTRITDFMRQAKLLGCESVTITGGGEPLMYKQWQLLLDLLYAFGIEVGLVTNGVLLDHLHSPMSWCRISCSDNLPDQLNRIGKDESSWFQTIKEAVNRNGQTDWAFSYVSTENTQLNLICDIISFAKSHNFTHVRLVSDILNADSLASKMLDIQKHFILTDSVDCSKVIFQPRSEWVSGQNPCFISLLKPVIGADGYVYPCCGAQYSLPNSSFDYEKELRMGVVEDLHELVKEQRFFDGSVCSKCYYSGYNYALGVLLSDLKHEKFV